jgi:hypothetical protein
MQLDDARTEFCKNLSDLDTHTDTPLGPPPHVIAKNDCAGESVTHIAADTKTRYDYGSDRQLVGVTLSGPHAGHTCNQSVTTYGKACSVRAEPALLCQCGFIACAAGVTIKLDAPANLDSLENARIELCHNDLCTAGTSEPQIDFSPGSMPGIYFSALDQGSTAAFMLSLREERPHAFVMFDIPDAKLHDGDRFRVRVTRSDGSKLYDRTETIVMYDLVGIGAPCTDHCQRKDLDHRSMSHEDAGI